MASVRVKGYLKRVPGRNTRVRVRGYMRKQRGAK